MSFITVDRENSTDVDLYYEDAGTGPAVVLIHGWPLSAKSWENQVKALVESGHRVISYDRRGFGRSSQPFTGYTYDKLAADLDAIITALDLSDVTLVGFSMGGGEVARYIATYGSEKVSKVVFAAAVTPFLKKTGENPDGGIDDVLAEKFLTGLTTDRSAFLDGFLDDFYSTGAKGITGSVKTLVSDLKKADDRAVASLASLQATIECVKAFAETDFRPDLALITIPTLVIHGDSDQVVPFEASGKRTNEAVTGSELVLVEGAPHGFNVTHAAEFNEALITFIDTDTGAQVFSGDELRTEQPVTAGGIPASRTTTPAAPTSTTGITS